MHKDYIFQLKSPFQIFFSANGVVTSVVMRNLSGNWNVALCQKVKWGSKKIPNHSPGQKI